jgi:DNA-binding MarR family transcriptional regulator
MTNPIGTIPSMSLPHCANGDRPRLEQVDSVMQASRALVGIAAASMSGIDDVVTVPQFRVLVIMFSRGPSNLAAVAAELAVNRSNASRICDRLIKAGLLQRRESSVDRRQVTLSLTGSGQQLVERVNRRRRSAIERVLRDMPDAQRDVLATALAAFAAAAGESADGASARTLLWPKVP